MNLGERSSTSPAKDKTFKDVTSNTLREEMMSPTRRSNRIRKIKVPYDNHSLEKSTASKGSKELPLDKPENPTTSAKVNGSSDLEKKSQFFEIDSEDEESFDSMFDDIFEQTYSKTLHPLLPKNLSDDSARERKFFKRNTLERSRVDLPNYINESNLPAEDVTKVFKIISKPTVLCDIPPDIKTTGKSSLKTYSNKRKSYDRNNVVESFGLPDYPIVPEVISEPLKPVLNDKLDADILDASEITILDLQYPNEPWVVANTNGEDVFPYFEDVRIKAAPKEHHFFKNGSFLDLKDAEECGIYANEINASVMTPKNLMTFEKSKEIDIEAIKINFKRMLSSPVKNTPKDVKRNASPRKRNATRPPGSEISFVENDSLTEDDTEFEFSNTASAQNKSRRSRSNVPIRSRSENKRKKANAGRVCDIKSEKSVGKDETMVKNTRTVIDKAEAVVTADVRKPDGRKRVIRSSLDRGKPTRCKEKYSTADVEKTNDTHEVFNKVTNHESETRRMLRSSSQERLVIRDKNVFSENMVKKYSPFGVKIAPGKCHLKSTDRVEKSNNCIEASKTSTSFHESDNSMLPDIILEKCNMNSNLLQNNLEKKMISPLRKHIKPLPEVRVVIRPLDMAQLADKLTGNGEYSIKRDELISPTKRNLRSNKKVGPDKETKQSHSKSIVKCLFENNPASEADSTKSDDNIQRYRIPKKSIQSDSDGKITRLDSVGENESDVATNLLDQHSNNLRKMEESVSINCSLNKSNLNKHKINDLSENQDGVLKNDLKNSHVSLNNEKAVCNDVLANNLLLEFKNINESSTNSLIQEEERIVESEPPKTTDKKIEERKSKTSMEKTLITTDTLHKIFDNSNDKPCKKQNLLLVEDLHQPSIDDNAAKEKTTITEQSDQNDIITSPDDGIIDVGNTIKDSETAKSTEISSANLYNKNQSTKKISESVGASCKVENAKNESKTSSNNTSRLIDTEDECITNYSTGFLPENETVNKNAANDIETKNPRMRNRPKEGKTNPDMAPRKLEKEKMFSPKLNQTNDSEVKAFDSEKLKEISSDSHKTNSHSTKHLADEEAREITNKAKNKNKDNTTLTKEGKLLKTDEECINSRSIDLENEKEFAQLESKQANEVAGILENADSTVEKMRRVSNRCKNIPNMSPKKLLKKQSETKLELEEILSDADHSKKKSHKSNDNSILDVDGGEKLNVEEKEIVDIIENNKNEDKIDSNKSLTLSDTDRECTTTRSNISVLENEKKLDIIEVEHLNSASENIEGRRRGSNRFKEGKNTDTISTKMEKENIFAPKSNQKNSTVVEAHLSEELEEISSETNKKTSDTTKYNPANEEVKEISDKVARKKNKDKTTLNKATELSKSDEKFIGNKSNDLEDEKIHSRVEVNTIGIVDEKRRTSNRFKECKSTPNTSPRKLFSPRLKKKLEAKTELEENSSDSDQSKKKSDEANSMIDLDGGETSNLAKEIVDNVENHKSEVKIHSNKSLTLSDTDTECTTTSSNILALENEKKLDMIELEHLNSASSSSESIDGRCRGRNRSKEGKNTDTTSRKVERENIFTPNSNQKNGNVVKVFLSEKLEEIPSETNKNNSGTTDHDSADEEVKEINDKVETKKNKEKTTLNKPTKLPQSNKSNHLENEKNHSKVESKRVDAVEEKRRTSNRFKECKSTPNMPPRKLFSPRLKKKSAKTELEENSSDSDRSKKKSHEAEDNSMLDVDKKSNLEAKEIVDNVENHKSEVKIDSNKSLTLLETDKQCVTKESNVLILENEKKLDKVNLEHVNTAPSASENVEERRRRRNRSKEGQNTDVIARKVEREKNLSLKLKQQSNEKVSSFEFEKSDNKTKLQTGKDDSPDLSINQIAKSNLEAIDVNKTVENNKNEDQSILTKPAETSDVDNASITSRSNDKLPEDENDGGVLENATSNVEDRPRVRNRSKEGKSNLDMTLRKIEQKDMFSPKSKQKNNEAKSHELKTATDSIPENKKGKSTTTEDIASTHGDKVKDNKNEDKASTMKSSKLAKINNQQYTGQKSTDLLENHQKFCKKESKQSDFENSAGEDKPKVCNRSKEGKNKVEACKDGIFGPNLQENCSSEGDFENSQAISSDNTNRKKSNETIHRGILNNVEISTNKEEIIVNASKILPVTDKECSNNEITPKKNTVIPHEDVDGNITISEQSTKKMEKEKLSSSRLKQKRLKLIGSKPNGLVVEKSLKIPAEEAANVQVADAVKEPILDRTIPVNVTQKRTSRKSEHIQAISEASSKRVSRRSAHNQTDSGDNVKANRRMSRRRSVDDSKLLNKNEEEYSGRLRRSKSVAPRAHSRKFVDDSELTNESPSYSGRLRSESVAPSTFRTRTKPSDKEVDGRLMKKSRGKVASEENKGIGECTSKRGKTFRQMKGVAENDRVVKRDRRFKDRDKTRADAEQKLANLEENKDFKDIKLEHEVDFQIGDIAWGQIGSHPFWPCLVTEEPGTGYHKKIFQGKRFQRVLYHVRFFGDKGRRAWINKHQIMPYYTQNDLKILPDKLKNECKTPPLLSYYYVRPERLVKWESAVAEAEHVKTKNVNQRLDMFFEMVALQSAKKDEIIIEDNLSEKSEPASVKRKHKDVQESDEKLETSPSRKKFKKDTNESEEKDDAVAVTQQNVDESANQNDKVLTRLRLKMPFDEISEIGSKTSSENTTDSTLDLMAAQKALFKRNNLFKGISRDKVCQHCCKPGDVLKCRGRCNGVYHVECSTQILQEQVFKKRRGRVPKSSPKQSRGSVDADDTKCLDDSTVKSDDLLDEEHVQIITVPSSIYNTPPRKTFPPNFRNMTLAEQIDYKMKEIMRKFESKTFYSDTIVETNTEDSNIHTTPRHIRRCDTSYPNVDRATTKIENITKPENQSLIRQFQKEVKEKLFMRHITADSDSVKCDVPDVEKKQLNGEETTDVKSKMDPKKFKCGFCITNLDPFCFICYQSISKKGNSIRHKCSLYQCGRFYHTECLKMWPQTQWSLIQTTKHKDSNKVVDSFVCPLHVCHTCASDDPRAATSRCSGDKIVKCLRCPSTYHSTNLCVPAGSTILSSTQIICPRHREKSKQYTINTTWCFLCSQGGNLICCETCPTSVHPECLPVNLTEDDKFICEDCESGRLPLYDEIVWVKLGKFRWWPALILFPNEIPDNIMNIRHGTGEFVVKFFGTYDHYWVNRGRSFLFQDGDTGHCNSVKKKVDAAFNTAVEEAVVAHKLKKEFKLSQEAESITSLKPPPYIRIKVNKPVGNVRTLDLDLSSTNACECDPSQPNPCGPDSDCLNRLLLTECSAEVCPAGNRCKNQSFEKREYPPMMPYKTQGRGWGLKTLAPIKKGQFVVEYVGELIDIEEYQRRIQKMHEQKEENYYFLTIDKDRMLDAGPKGNMARFMNHCCQPNCETQKWTVSGDTRVGLFATEDIPAETELTFNYNLECVGKEKKVCRCGAPNCSGFIGVKAKQDTDSKKPKKSYKKKLAVEPIILPPCFMCGKKDDVVACNNKVCNKAYHLKCLELVELPEGNKFVCPWHNCNICSKRTIRCCVKCVNSFCPSHSEGNVRYDNLLGFVCNAHDPMRAPSNDMAVKLKKRRSNMITDETAVTSTTSDDVDDEEDAMPLLLRRRLQSERDASITFNVNESSTPLKKFKTLEDMDKVPLLLRLKMRKSKNYHDLDTESESETDCNQSTASASLKKLDYSHYESSQDESAVSSATLSDFEEETVSKRKRGRSRRVRSEKKSKLCVQSKSTANSLLRDVDSLRSNSNSELDSRHNELENR